MNGDHSSLGTDSKIFVVIEKEPYSKVIFPKNTLILTTLSYS